MSTGNLQTPTTIAGWAIWIVVVIAIVAVVYVMLQVTGIAIPAWIVTLFWICLAAFVVIKVIQFLAGLST